MKTRKPLFLYTLIFLLLGAGITACGDNPVDHDDDDDDHAEAVGLRLMLGDVDVYRVLNGQVSCQEEPCELVVIEGEQTPIFTVEFLAADGSEIHEEDLDEEFSLEFEIANSAIAEFERDGTWSFHVIGKQAGETRTRLHLQHADEHPDFSTPPLDRPTALTIRVTED